MLHHNLDYFVLVVETSFLVIYPSLSDSSFDVFMKLSSNYKSIMFSLKVVSATFLLVCFLCLKEHF